MFPKGMICMKNPKIKGYGTANKKTSFKDAFSVLGLCVLCILIIGMTFLISGTKNDVVNNKSNVYDETKEEYYEDIQEVYKEDSIENDEEEQSEKFAVNEEKDEIIEIVDEDEIYETDSVVLTSAKAIEMIAPLKGNVLKGFSNNELVYSKTLDDWRLHTGVDINAKIGTTVLVCEDGVVEYAGKDIRYGHTIIVSHNDGFKSVYSNLTGTDMVKIGRDLKKGDPIGMVGDSAICESSDESHLHFELQLNGVNVDPLKYFEV